METSVTLTDPPVQTLLPRRLQTHRPPWQRGTTCSVKHISKQNHITAWLCIKEVHSRIHQRRDRNVISDKIKLLKLYLRLHWSDIRSKVNANFGVSWTFSSVNVWLTLIWRDKSGGILYFPWAENSFFNLKKERKNTTVYPGGWRVERN